MINKKQFWKCHEALLEFGMKPVKKDIDIESEYEISYMKAGSPLYIELHKTLFPLESEVYGVLIIFLREVQKIQSGFLRKEQKFLL